MTQLLTYQKVHELPDVYQIEVPFPNVVTTETNCFVVVDGDDALVIDSGAPSDESARRFCATLEHIGVDLSQARFFLTHAHYDHAGLLPMVAPEGATVFVDRREAEAVQRGFGAGDAARTCKRFREEGVPDRIAFEDTGAITSSTELDLSRLDVRTVEEGDLIVVGGYVFRALSTPGHTPGHMALYHEESGICFTGDLLLFVITPGLSLRFDGGDALGMYLWSLKKVAALDCKRLFISHGESRLDFADRMNQIKWHHERRCRIIEEIVAAGVVESSAAGLTGREIIGRVPWNIPVASVDDCKPLQRWSVYSQGIALLDHLVAARRIVRVPESLFGATQTACRLAPEGDSAAFVNRYLPVEGCSRLR